MTSNELFQHLRNVEQLIALLAHSPFADEQDLEDLRWLRARRKSLLAVLAMRRALRRKKIVSLELWRSGGPSQQEALAQPA